MKAARAVKVREILGQIPQEFHALALDLAQHDAKEHGPNSLHHLEYLEAWVGCLKPVIDAYTQRYCEETVASMSPQVIQRWLAESGSMNA